MLCNYYNLFLASGKYIFHRITEFITITVALFAMNVSSGDYDFLIIGAGSTGTSIAYHLALMGKKVAVVDRGGIAAGNTGKSSALVRTHYSNELIARMALYSQNIFRDFQKIGYSGFTRTGMIFPFGRNYKDVARENVGMLRSIGVDEPEIDVKKVREYFHDVNLDGYEYICYEPESGYADPVATSNSFADKARELGAQFIPKKSVASVESRKEGAEAELAGGGKMRASKIILAANVWTNSLLSASGISKSHLLPIHASLHGIIYLRRPEEYRGIRPTLWDPRHLSYYKMEGTSLTAVGSLDPKLDEKAVDPDEPIPEAAEDDYVEKHLEILTETLPSMEKATLVSTLTGLYDMTPDGQAIIDSLSPIGLDNIYAIAGLSGHGFKLSPAYGKIVSDMATGQAPEKSLFDWAHFSMGRFSSGKMIKSRYEDIGTIY